MVYRIPLFTLLAVLVSSAVNGQIVQVKDILPGSYSSNPSNFKVIGNVMYFAADDGVHGNELWRTDGTESGTYLVKDIDFGSSNPEELTDVNGVLFFTAEDGTHGRELWKSDGTEQGTILVKDIFQGTDGSEIAYMTASGGQVFFQAKKSASDVELWKSDGTESGTVMVKDIGVIPGGGGGGVGSNPTHLVDVNGTLFFQANRLQLGKELWKSDGTESGTVLVKDIAPGTVPSGPSAASSTPILMTNLNGVVYFSASSSTGSSRKLWKSDGTEAGTVRVTNAANDLNDLVNLGGMLYFGATDATTGREPWMSDGTETGTTRIADLAPGFAIPGFQIGNSDPESFTLSNGVVYFIANDESSGRELWKTNGTESGTVMVKDIYQGSENSSTPEYLISHNDTLYFVADDGSTGREVWKSDGTLVGTQMVDDQLGMDFEPMYLTSLGNDILFTAFEPGSGVELWKIGGASQTSIADNELQELLVYPNPTSGQVHVNLLSVKPDLTIIVINSLGEIVFKEIRKSVQEFDYQLPDRSGIYFIQLTTADGLVRTLKVVKE